MGMAATAVAKLLLAQIVKLLQIRKIMKNIGMSMPIYANAWKFVEMWIYAKKVIVFCLLFLLQINGV